MAAHQRTATALLREISAALGVSAIASEIGASHHHGNPARARIAGCTSMTPTSF
jgi:hypothetical protein